MDISQHDEELTFEPTVTIIGKQYILRDLIGLF